MSGDIKGSGVTMRIFSRVLIAFLVACLCGLASAPLLQAQESHANTKGDKQNQKRPSLSFLGFDDEKPNAEKPEKPTPAEVLRFDGNKPISESAKKLNVNTSVPTNTPPAQAADTTGAKATSSPVVPASGVPRPLPSFQGRPTPERVLESAPELAVYPFILPQVNGVVEGDAVGSFRITSERTWGRGNATSCKQPNGIDNVCAKANAVKEILFRITRNNEFFETHCLGVVKCTVDGDVPAIEHMMLKPADTAKLTIIDKPDICQYRLERDPDAKWMMLEPSEVGCVCVPSACIQ